MLAPLVIAAVAAQPAQAELDAVGARGRLLWEYDQAAWHSTDRMRAKLPNPERVLRGFIVEPVPGGHRAIYYGLNGREAYPVYTADVRGGRVIADGVVPEGARTPLNPTLQRMIQAREVAAGSGYRPCGAQTFNTVVIAPVNASEPIDVYLLTPQPARDAFPFGGHYRVRVDAAGRIASKRGFARSCLTMPKPSRGPGGEKPVGMVVSHLLDPHPTEIHVFNSLAAKFPVYVPVPSGQLYRVAGEKIRAVAKPGD